MADTFFKTYKEAAYYAKRRAQELGLSVCFGRHNEGWVVNDPVSSSKHIEKIDKRSPTQVRVVQHWEPWQSWGSTRPETSQEKLEREERQREYADQKAYEEAIAANTPHEATCEACDRPISRCRCSS